jgi:hypothetical protein
MGNKLKEDQQEGGRGQHHICYCFHRFAHLDWDGATGELASALHSCHDYHFKYLGASSLSSLIFL